MYYVTWRSILCGEGVSINSFLRVKLQFCRHVVDCLGCGGLVMIITQEDTCSTFYPFLCQERVKNLDP